MTKRKSYDKAFKLEVVQLVESGKRVAEVARELDFAEQTLHNWVKKFSKDGEAAFIGSGNLKPADKERKGSVSILSQIICRLSHTKSTISKLYKKLKSFK